MKVFRKKRERDSPPSASPWFGCILPVLLGIGIGALFLLGSGKGALAQDISSSGPRLQETLEGEGKGKESPAKIWQSYREFAQKGAWDKSRNELEKLYQGKLNQGIRNHNYYAIVLLRESAQLPKEAVEEMGPILLSYAEKMAPDFSEVYYAQARWIWSHQPFSLPHFAWAAWYWLEGGFYSYANLEESIPQYANLGYGLVFSFLIALGIYAVVLAFRYYPFFHHHLRHLLNLDFHPILQAVLGGALLLLPFALGVGWLGMFLAWLLAFWMYESRGERTVSLVLLILVLLLPSAVRVSSSFVSALSENGVPEIIRANNGVWSPELHRQLLNLQQRQAGDPDLLQAVSLVEKRMGKFSEAEQHLRRWIEIEANSSAAHNNLGNVYLAIQRVDQAMEAYQNAIRLDNTRTESYYNLGQAYLLNLLLNEAESEFRRAKELRPQLISFYTSIASRHPNRLTIDRIIEPIHLWKRLLGETPERERLAKGFWAFLGVRYPLPFEEILGALFLLLLGGIHWGGRRKPLIRRCERCGRLICSRCSRSLVIGNQCLQCVHAFSKNPTGDSQRLKEKRLEVAQHQLRQFSLSRWLSFLLPGAGHLHRGHAKEGFFYIFIGSFFLVRAILGDEWIPNPLDLEISSSAPWMATNLFLCLLFYGWVQFRFVQILKKEAKFYFRPAE
jgi:tetratricopeptide (TPR) repeat protein